jgi:nucleotide-binding universal stress UspA family protein
MFPPKRILFPVDFSERCGQAARMVETFAGHFQSELILLNVVEPLTYNDLPPDGTAAAEDRLKTYLEDDLRHFEVRRVLMHGDPATRIVEYAENAGVDLIMMPTHGFGRFRRFILGSVTAKVLHDAECPVWTGAHVDTIPSLENISFKRVVCAVDLAKQPCAPLKWAQQFAEEMGARLTIVYAVPAAGDVPGVYCEQEWKEILVHNAEAEIDDLKEQLGLEADVRVEADEVPRGVTECAKAVKADLLVLGRSTDAGVLGRLRTNAYSIIRQSPCPTISV